MNLAPSKTTSPTKEKTRHSGRALVMAIAQHDTVSIAAMDGPFIRCG
jgi:hypothetical protein